MLGAKTFRFGFGCMVLLLCAFLCCGVVSGEEIQKAKSHLVYHIGTGDVLQISVDHHPEWSTTVVVKANGEITVPWHRDAKVGGLSVELAFTLLREQLQSLNDWSCVTLTVKQRKGSWVHEKEPFFVDVPSPGQSSAARVS
jgi:hypothetical protein